MKLSVGIYSADTRRNPPYTVVKRGEIRWDGKQLSAAPDRPSDMVLLATSSPTPFYFPGEPPIDPKAEPERWLRSLWRMYRSPYLTAMKAAPQ
jgi:hypothetical protein